MFFDDVHDTADNLLRLVEGLVRSNPLVCAPVEWTDSTVVIKCVPSGVGSRRAMNRCTTAILMTWRDTLLLRHTCGGLLLVIGVMFDFVLLVGRVCDFMSCALEPFAALRRALLDPLARNVADARRLGKRLRSCVGSRYLTLLGRLTVALGWDMRAMCWAQLADIASDACGARAAIFLGAQHGVACESSSYTAAYSTNHMLLDSYLIKSATLDRRFARRGLAQLAPGVRMELRHLGAQAVPAVNPGRIGRRRVCRAPVVERCASGSSSTRCTPPVASARSSSFANASSAGSCFACRARRARLVAVGCAAVAPPT